MWKSNFFYGGREFCFKKYGLTTHYHPEFIHTLCSIPATVKDRSLDTINTDWMGIRFFLTVIQKERLPLYEYLSIDNSSSKLDFGGSSEWQNALSVVRDHIDAKNVSNSNKANYLSGALFFIGKLSEKNYVPRLPSVRGFKRSPSKVKTVVDTPLSESARQNILEVASDTNFDEIQTVYQHILLELTDIDVPDGFHTLGIAAKVEWVLSRRLGKVRVAIDKRIKEQLEVRKEGLLAIRKYRYLNSLFDQFFSFNKSTDGRVNLAGIELKNLTYNEYRCGLLSWFWYRNKGIQFKNHNQLYIRATKLFNTLRKREFLPLDRYGWSDTWFANRLGLTSDMYTPCMLLLIFDNFMNVSNARTIPINGISINSDGLPSSITWFKNRADSWLFKTVSNELEISSADVFKHVKRATRRYREYCVENNHKDQQDFLFLSYYSSKKSKEGVVRPLNPASQTFTEHGTEFLRVVGESRWTMTPDMLRNSLLLLSGFKGGVEKINEDAQHSNNRTSTIYHNRPAARAVFHEEMREFKEWLQTLITLNIDDAPLKLGIDPSRYEAHKSQIMASRFGGLFCKDPLAGVQDGTKKGEVCNKIARCLLCKNKKNLFVESVDNITHLLQWHEALEYAVDRKLIDPNQNINWYFWFRFIEEMIARLQDNRVSKLRNNALISAAKTRMSELNNPYLKIDFKEVS
ncbi:MULTISPECIES: hypothetical protein [Vibrio harveyi group]|uniref:Uncharacterized protein n=1 Tax=Vibrio diabolicus TaxID=50719 RepID=A0AA92LVF7_9VIBR|nr:hypothetical protein [Vibrio diabolicus]MCG6238964.1 hypothetical protein [Vibrio diabolicus]QRG83340.1 hypothetical protein JOS67_03215 [Vibrio diabolicus]